MNNFLFAASLAKRSNSPLQEREKLYLLAVGNYRSGEFSKSRKLLEKCLEVCYPFPFFSFHCRRLEENLLQSGILSPYKNKPFIPCFWTAFNSIYLWLASQIKGPNSEVKHIKKYYELQNYTLSMGERELISLIKVKPL